MFVCVAGAKCSHVAQGLAWAETQVLLASERLVCQLVGQATGWKEGY